MEKKYWKFPYSIVILTAFFGVLPFIIFYAERKLGILPSADEWNSRGWNHGPWRWNLEGFLIGYPSFFLILYTVFVALRKAIREKIWLPVLLGALLIGMQVLALIIQVFFLFSLVD